MATNQDTSSLWVCVCSAVFTSAITFQPYIQSEFVKLFRGIFVHLKFYAVIYILFALNGDQVAPWLLDIFFPMVRLTLFVSENALFPLIGGLFSDSIAHLVSWNVLMISVFLILNFCFCGASLSCVLRFSILYATDAQMTISAVFCKWRGGMGYWPSTICFSMTLQWLLVAVFFPASTAHNRRYYEADRLLPQDFKSDSEFNWICTLGEVSAFIAWLHVCAIWLSANFAVQTMVSAAAIWLLTYIHETMWPFELRLTNQVVGDMFKAMWLLVIWLLYRDPLVFGAIVLYSLRKVVFH